MSGDGDVGESSARRALEAVDLGVGALQDLGIDPGYFRLVRVENDLDPKHPEPSQWRLDFKAHSTIPETPGGRLGKGGSLSVLVDLADGSVVKLRGGD